MNSPLDPDSQTIIITSNLRQYRIKPKPIERLVHSASQKLGVAGWEVSLRFVSKAAIQKLNAHYRGKVKPTDVLSFPQETWKPPLKATTRQKTPSKPFQVLGDIVLCPAIAENNAQQIGQSLSREISFLLIHGLLHLCGHDHEKAKDEQLMLAEQRYLMKSLEQLTNKLLIHSTKEKPK